MLQEMVKWQHGNKIDSQGDLSQIKSKGLYVTSGQPLFQNGSEGPFQRVAVPRVGYWVSSEQPCKKLDFLIFQFWLKLRCDAKAYTLAQHWDLRFSL